MVRKPKPVYVSQKEWDDGEDVVQPVGPCGLSTTGDQKY
jgi:hypothetical protein